MANQNAAPFSLSKLALLLPLLQGHDWQKTVEEQLAGGGYRYTLGRVGAMDLMKVVAAVETAAKRNRLIDEEQYREVHALYHAIIEAIQGVGRGTMQFGEILRTVGLTFAVVRGPMFPQGAEPGDWIAVCLYGTIGAPRKGFEHEVLGFGINHV
ncbi:Hut operon regulatory protein HutP [Acididesulfobacillus acetoxydans]|uniref:Hut operon positive regulatory protein n=1 Tax=Acididesulfobacillus acetoxydans TaxID=1561005 RepID=A0A8S0WWE3_9FIRM|nr:hut operon transcriptional regulator HutP [Acididesulfobacillus acetoxydans]CAA7600221.1 Hut operon regulatory protein HutP [Acididesulfobacillus acetoxydans]CEJ09599.1 Hut operon positive regulatory protein [Acididesulfobacillus acetoxydans]